MNLLEDTTNLLWEQENVIYCYTNKINNKKYVGQTIKTLKNRHKQHMIESRRKGHGYNYHLHNSIRKYGIDNFTLEILHIADKYSLDLLEIYYIEKLNLLDRNYGYNTSSGGSNGNPYAGKTDEEMKKIRKRMSESQVWQKGENHPMYGRHHTEESKKKISKIRKEKGISKGKNNPMYGKHHSEESKKKIGKKVAQYDLNGNLIKTWDYVKQASDELKINKNGIAMCCRGERKTAGGYIWKYVEKD